MANQSKDRRDVRGTLGALLFIGVGAIAWWDSIGLAHEAVVFPRAVIGLMVLCSGILIVRNLLGHATPEGVAAPGSSVRRIALIAAMLVAALIMPYVGFVISALAAYIAIMFIAMYERWTPLRCVLYPLAGAIIVIGFYLVFQRAFLVPLPEPAWFNLPF